MEKNPLQRAMEDWHLLQDDLMITKDQLREANDLNNKLLTEVDFLRSELDKVIVEKDRYQRYSVEMATRLSSIKEVITTAESDARMYALKPPIPSQAAELPEDDVRSVQGIISRLPVNAFQ